MILPGTATGPAAVVKPRLASATATFHTTLPVRASRATSMRVARGHEHLVVVDGQVAHRPRILIPATGRATPASTRRGSARASGTAPGVTTLAARCGRFIPVFPQQVAGCGVQRVDDVARVGQVHDAVVHERCRLLSAGFHRPRPRECQAANRLPVDLAQRAVAPGVVRTPEVQPVARARIAEHGIGDRLELLDLRRSEPSGCEDCGRDRGRKTTSHLEPPLQKFH